MFKKITSIFLCLIFLLSISCVVADENISDYPSLPDDIGVMEECSEIDGAEIDGETSQLQQVQPEPSSETQENLLQLFPEVSPP